MTKLIPGVIYTVVLTVETQAPALFKVDQSGNLHAHISGNPATMSRDLNNTVWDDNHWLRNGNYRFLRVCDNVRGDISESEAYKILKLAGKVQRRAIAKAGGLLKYKKQEWDK